MSGPFVALYGGLPPLLKGIVAKWGITPGPDGAGFLKELWATKENQERTVKSILAQYPETVLGNGLKSKNHKQGGHDIDHGTG